MNLRSLLLGSAFSGAYAGGGAPTAPSCGGTGAVAGVNNVFTVTFGGTSASTCTIDFSSTLSSTPFCLAGQLTQATGPLAVTSRSAGSIVVTAATASASGSFTLLCVPTS